MPKNKKYVRRSINVSYHDWDRFAAICIFLKNSKSKIIRDFIKSFCEARDIDNAHIINECDFLE